MDKEEARANLPRLLDLDLERVQKTKEDDYHANFVFSDKRKPSNLTR